MRSTTLAKPGRALGLTLGLLSVGGCEASQPVPTSIAIEEGAPTRVAKPEKTRMWMTVGERRFAMTLAENDTGRAFAARLPLTLEMAELNGNEKHADLPEALPANASRPGTIREGDVMLYGIRTVVVFYASFSSPYAYTRIGRIEDPGALAAALGPGAARLSFSVE
jgi:hypothetical protein